MNVLLPAMIGLPLAVALLLLLVRGISDGAAVRIATGTAAVNLVLAVVASVQAAPFDRSGPGLEVDASWIPALGVRAHLGMDGISTPLVLLTALMGLLVTAHALRVRPSAGRLPGLMACFLAVEGGALATFTSLDLVLFYIAFEVVLVPMWFVIALWGDDKQPPRPRPRSTPLPGGQAARTDAAWRFMLFTAVGSAIMLLGLLLVALQTGTTDLVVLADGAGAGMSHETQVLAASLIVLGLAVKAPMFPLHTWLPPAHTIAPTGGSMLLAAVLLKMGTYGLVRIALPVAPEGFETIAPALGILGMAGAVWGGLACLVERDLKRLIAFSSVAHMGFVLVGVASMTPEGLQGALFVNIAHGLITGLLFLVVGSLKDRHHTADLHVLGTGLRDRLPTMGWLLALGCFAGLGLPGLAGFWGELLAIVGTWGGEDALGATARPLAVIGVVSTLIASAYLLRVLWSIWHGPREERWRSDPDITDATAHEVALAAPLVVATVALGLLPWLLLDITGDAVRLLLGVGGVTP
ncbi:MAG: NADH-quinone oxidoreductase subunit [Actinomycetota bacterium]|nr:NADH-quinone oxidoreductase subunit [Actinomycetota bacterium]